MDETFRGRFLGLDPANERFFAGGRKQAAFRPRSLCRRAADGGGIASIEALGLDTYADADRFYSYRRSTHRGEADYGRQLSCIAVPQ